MWITGNRTTLEYRYVIPPALQFLTEEWKHVRNFPPEKIFFSSLSFQPIWLPSGHRYCPSILVCLLLLLLHKVKEGVEKTGKIVTEKDKNYFLNLVMEISLLTTSLKPKENFDGLCFCFRRAGCSSFTKTRQDFNFYTLEKKNYYNVSHGCCGNNISVASAVPHGGDLLDVHSFLLVEVA